MLGIGRKTGSKWRNGYAARDPKTGVVRHYAPIVQVRHEAPISPRFLSEDERVRIADLRKAGRTIREVATTLGRSPSTVSRELRRNSGSTGVYRPFHAHKLARTRRSRVRPGKIAVNPVLRQKIEVLMRKRWSPAQISWQLRTEYPDDRGMQVVPETIYRDLYDYRGGALKRDYCRLLRTKRNRRKPTRLIPRRRSRFGGDVLMICDRPFAPADRSVAGHWEGDLIMGRHNRSAIATLVERHSRYLLLARVDAADRSESLRVALTTAMVTLPAQLRQTLTWDQGWEMSQHAAITAATGMKIYFCEPHSPWQRGSNENVNGLLKWSRKVGHLI
jgi:transposase, IS30 family